VQKIEAEKEEIKPFQQFKPDAKRVYYGLVIEFSTVIVKVDGVSTK